MTISVATKEAPSTSAAKVLVHLVNGTSSFWEDSLVYRFGLTSYPHGGDDDSRWAMSSPHLMIGYHLGSIAVLDFGEDEIPEEDVIEIGELACSYARLGAGLRVSLYAIPTTARLTDDASPVG